MSRFLIYGGLLVVSPIAACTGILSIEERPALMATGGGGAAASQGGGGAAGQVGGGGASEGGNGGQGGGPDAMCPHTAAVLADGPIAYWHLDDLGATATDALGPFHGSYSDVTQNIPPLVSACPDGSAIRFDNAAALVDLGDVLDFEGRAPFTVEAWVDISAGTATGGIISKLGGDGWTLHYAVAGNVGFRRIVAGLNDDTYMLAPPGIHHLAGRYDGIEVCIFVDAQSACSSSDVALPDVPVSLRFSDSAFDGALDEVAIYDYALSEAAIAEHYVAGLQ